MKKWICLTLLVLAVIAPRRGFAAASPCSEDLPALFHHVSPAVVNISSIMVNPFKPADRVDEVVGSGFIIKPEALILTNAHVVFRHQAITVTLDDGRTMQATLLGADPILDLAVLRLSSPSDTLPTVALGDSDAIRVGEAVAAIGNPFGLEQTLTRGVVSGINKLLSDPALNVTLALIQTDAAVNPGNSGGPLLNQCGEVIGINTAALSDAENIGFAIPINVAKRVLPQLVHQGRIIRPWLGIVGRVIGKDLHELLTLPLVPGLLVEAIEAGSPAEQAGLHGGNLPIAVSGEEFLFGGDIVTMINGKRIDTADALTHVISGLRVGDKVSLTVTYEGATRHIEFRLPERPILPGDLPSDERRSLQPMHHGSPRVYPSR
jgi:S1-C subfamily serine protease